MTLSHLRTIGACLRAARLRLPRERRALEKVGPRVGIHPKLLSAYERDKTKIPFERAILLAKYYGISLLELVPPVQVVRPRIRTPGNGVKPILLPIHKTLSRL